MTWRVWNALLVVCAVCTINVLPALAQGQWELRICAEAFSFPESSRETPGFENRIAALLAEELGATPVFVWTGSANSMVVDQYLLSGECDMMMGVADGTDGVLNTVPYYRTPYVFVYRTDSGLRLDSFEDPVLGDLTLSTYPNTIPHQAMIDLGLGENFKFFQPVPRPGGPDRDAPIIEAVMSGQVDVAVLYGPIAGYYASHETDVLSVVPVKPEIIPPLSQMFRVWTIGVRPHDESLRDGLNVALARRWDDIQGVFAEFGTPLLSVQRPTIARADDRSTLLVGAVLPMPTRLRARTDSVGAAARVGVLTAEDLVGRAAAEAGIHLDVLLASSPTGESARQAARRLVLVDGVTALVGGIGEGQAEAIAEVADELGVLFFNIGSPDIGLREACFENAFHIEASATMYIEALRDWLVASGHRSWFFVYETSDEGERRHRFATASLAATEGVEVVGTAGVEPGQLIYNEVLDAIEAVDPDVVMLLLTAEDQEFFLGQFSFRDLEPVAVGFPDPISQTRDFLFRLQQVAGETDHGLRASLWETTLEENGAKELIDRFISRSGIPMDASGWAAYAAVSILHTAYAAAKGGEAADVTQSLLDPDAAFDVYKGDGLHFDPATHQLRQPLYLVRIDPAFRRGANAFDQLGVVDIVAELPPPWPSGPEGMTCFGPP